MSAHELVELFCRWAGESPRTKHQLAITLEQRVIGTTRKVSGQRKNGVAFPLEWITRPRHEDLLTIVRHPIVRLALFGAAVEIQIGGDLHDQTP